MPNFRLVLEYDGTDFEGWQVQAGDGRRPRTVQGVLEEAVAELVGERVSVTGAGRTDTGVHAEGQVASARFDTRLEPDELQRALNARLPRDLAVRALDVVPDSFHARRDARSKLYVYRLWTGAHRSPLRARTHHWVHGKLDLDAMRAAAAHLVGRHDFASFRAAGSSPTTSVRAILRLDVVGSLGSEVRIDVEGDGFLRHMVRNLAGTLLEVARGRRPPDSIPALLAAADRTRAGPTAPPHALTLVRVTY